MTWASEIAWSFEVRKLPQTLPLTPHAISRDDTTTAVNARSRAKEKALDPIGSKRNEEFVGMDVSSRTGCLLRKKVSCFVVTTKAIMGGRYSVKSGSVPRNLLNNFIKPRRILFARMIHVPQIIARSGIRIWNRVPPLGSA